MTNNANIFPTNEILKREDKQKLIQQRGMVLWLTGLSCSGKTTIAVALEKELHKNKILTRVLDGDNVRLGVNKNLGFTEEDRIENIRRISEVAKLFVDTGIVTICCFISPTKATRTVAKTIIGNDDYFEIFVNTSLEVCEERDIKGLYKRARAGEIQNFTGIDSPYEIPENPFFEVKTPEQSVDEIVAQIYSLIKPVIQFNHNS